MYLPALFDPFLGVDKEAFYAKWYK